MEPKRRRREPKAVCPFSRHEALLGLRDKTLVKVRDVEEMVVLGRETKACPYYGSRLAVPAAQVRLSEPPLLLTPPPPYLTKAPI